jgi:hypothetical protein
MIHTNKITGMTSDRNSIKKDLYISTDTVIRKNSFHITGSNSKASW